MTAKQREKIKPGLTILLSRMLAYPILLLIELSHWALHGTWYRYSPGELAQELFKNYSSQ